MSKWIITKWTRSQIRQDCRVIFSRTGFLSTAEKQSIIYFLYVEIQDWYLPSLLQDDRLANSILSQHLMTFCRMTLRRAPPRIDWTMPAIKIVRRVQVYCCQTDQVHQIDNFCAGRWHQEFLLNEKKHMMNRRKTTGNATVIAFVFDNDAVIGAIMDNAHISNSILRWPVSQHNRLRFFGHRHRLQTLYDLIRIDSKTMFLLF